MIARRLTLTGLAWLCALAGVLTLASVPAFAVKEYVPGSTFGSEGSGNGQFKEPTGVAVNDSEPLTEPTAGDVYVLDKGNNRVEWFNSVGSEFEGQFNGSATPAKSFLEPEGIAVDNSPLSASHGDVYVTDVGHQVVDKFSATGAYISQLKETTAGSLFGKLQGVTVDPSGDVWVYEGEGNFDEFSDTGSFVKAFTGRGNGYIGVAVDANANVYAACCGDEVGKFESTTGTQVAEFSEGVSALAVNPSTNNLLVDRRSSIALYKAFFTEEKPSPLQTFPKVGLSNSQGIAVNAAGTLYASQRTADNIEIFDYVLLPGVTTEPASDVTNTEVTLHGSVDPEGEAIEECRFEYGLSEAEPGHYEHSVPCAQAPSSITGTSTVPVSVVVSGLHATYHFRLTARNANGVKGGGDEILTVFPSVEGESFSDVGSTEAIVSARIDAAGLPTTYHVEYGTSVAYGSRTPETSAGAGREAIDEQVRLSGLEPGAVNHFRFVATNALGAVPGGDVAFTTFTIPSASASTLPDNRVYELVSPVESVDGNVSVPISQDHQVFGVDTNVGSPEDTYSTQPYRAAADGDAVAYQADPGSVGGDGYTGNGLGNQFLATRSANGWNAVNIAVPGADSTGFSTDLSVATLVRGSGGQSVYTPEGKLTPDAPSNCNVLYSRTANDGAYHTLLGETQTPGSCGVPIVAGISADNSHVIFESEAALTPGSAPGKEVVEGVKAEENLYESFAGHLYLINVLPNGKQVVNASFGNSAGLSGEQPDETINSSKPYPRHNYDRVLSSDGSRVVWTDLNTEKTAENPAGGTRLFVRENAASASASTVQVDASVGGGGQYWAASSDGGKVFFTKAGDLYEYALGSPSATDLTPAGGVLGLTGVSNDGSYIYLVAANVLAANENANKEKATKGAPNLYVLHVGNPQRFVATLSPEDNAREQIELYGDWRSSLIRRTAEITPDGHNLVFESTRPLTGYDNNPIVPTNGCQASGSVQGHCPEVFVYNTDTQQLSCASCNPTGARPVAGEPFLPRPASPIAFAEHGTGQTIQYRVISADGARVFFNTPEGLVPQDTNGVMDVYEWERYEPDSKTNSCTNAPGERPSETLRKQEKGCIYLISGNIGVDTAFLVDSSESGNDVFFTSRSQLVPQDHGGEHVVLYDARVNGGFPQSSECTGTGCQGVPPAPPIFATPSSVTFNGVGNFPPPVSAVKSQHKAKPVKCKKGHVKRKGKCIKVKKSAKRTKRSGKGRK